MDPDLPRMSDPVDVNSLLMAECGAQDVTIRNSGITHFNSCLELFAKICLEYDKL